MTLHNESVKRLKSRATARALAQFARTFLAAALAGMLVAGPAAPAFAQNPQENAPAAPATKASSIPPVGSLGLGKHDFTRGPSAFPNLINPYKQIHLEAPNLENAPRIEQLVHDGKLELSLQDAVELALENNLDIVVQRYNPWIAQTDVLRTLGGGAARGISGTGTASVLGSIPSLNFDPQITSSISFDDRKTPVNNPLISGTGTTPSASSPDPPWLSIRYATRSKEFSISKDCCRKSRSGRPVRENSFLFEAPWAAFLTLPTR
jgi:hypothetical protein